MIPAEAVEAAVSVAAKALFAEEEYGSEDRPDIDEKWLNFLSIADREQYRRMARAALEAAAPYIRAQTLNDVLETRVEDCAKAWEKGWDAGMRFQPKTTNPYRTTK